MDQNIPPAAAPIPPAAAPAAKPIDQNILMQLIAYLRNKPPARPAPAPGATGPGMAGRAETALRGRQAQIDAAINQASQ